MSDRSRQVYLDYAATSPIRRRVVDAMTPFWMSAFGNPSSIHTPGRRARVALEDARERIADLLEVDPAAIIFTGSGTEAANLALQHIRTGPRPTATTVVSNRAEHEAVLKPIHAFERAGQPVKWLRSTSTAAVLPDSFDVPGDQLMFSVMLVNNETGAINSPLAVRGENADSVYFADAVQALGFLDVRPRTLGVDLMSLSAHKIGGPKGVGLLCAVDEVLLDPIILGGEQERGRRAGTENVAGIVGFARAMEIAFESREESARSVRRLRDHLMSSLEAALGDRIVLNTPREPAISAPHIVNVAFPPIDGLAVDGEMLLLNLDMEGVFVSSGSACTSGSLKPSHVLLEAGLEPKTAAAAVRFSLGEGVSTDDLDFAVDRLSAVLGRMTAAGSTATLR